MEDLGRLPDLGTEAAATALREHCEEKKRKREEQTEQRDQPAGEDEEPQVTPSQIASVLDASDNLDRIEKWPAAYNLIRREIDTGEDISDITDQEVWAQADSELKGRLIEVASLYLAENQPNPSDWKSSPDVWGEVECSTITALRLLQKEAPARLEGWDDERWEQWAPLIVAYEPVTDEDHTDLRRRGLPVLSWSHEKSGRPWYSTGKPSVE